MPRLGWITATLLVTACRPHAGGPLLEPAPGGAAGAGGSSAAAGGPAVSSAAARNLVHVLAGRDLLVYEAGSRALSLSIPLGGVHQWLRVQGTRAFLGSAALGQILAVETAGQRPPATWTTPDGIADLACAGDRLAVLVRDPSGASLVRLLEARTLRLAASARLPWEGATPGSLLAVPGRPLVLAFGLSPAGKGLGAAVDAETGRLVGSFALEADGRPAAPALTPDGGTLLVPDLLGSRLLVFEAATQRRLAAIPLPGPAAFASAHPAREEAYVSGTAAIYVVDLALGRVARTIPVPLSPGRIAFDRQGAAGYCAHSTVVGAALSGRSFVSRIETASGRVETASVRGVAREVVLSPRDDALFAPHAFENTVSVLDPGTLRILRELPTHGAALPGPVAAAADR